jgi:hypothetical protein
LHKKEYHAIEMKMFNRKSGRKEKLNPPSDKTHKDDEQSFGEISPEEPENEFEGMEVKTIQEFLEMKKLQNEVLKKIIQNMDHSENQ